MDRDRELCTKAAFLGKIFIKDKRFEAEREYRFVIWSEDEPAEDHVDLKMSLAMQEAMLPLITPSRETSSCAKTRPF